MAPCLDPLDLDVKHESEQRYLHSMCFDEEQFQRLRSQLLGSEDSCLLVAYMQVGQAAQNTQTIEMAPTSTAQISRIAKRSYKRALNRAQ